MNTTVKHNVLKAFSPSYRTDLKNADKKSKLLILANINKMLLTRDVSRTMTELEKEFPGSVHTVRKYFEEELSKVKDFDAMPEWKQIETRDDIFFKQLATYIMRLIQKYINKKSEESKRLSWMTGGKRRNSRRRKRNSKKRQSRKRYSKKRQSRKRYSRKRYSRKRQSRRRT